MALSRIGKNEAVGCLQQNNVNNFATEQRLGVNYAKWLPKIWLPAYLEPAFEKVGQACKRIRIVFVPDEWVIENRNSNHVGSHAIMFYRHLESGILRLRIRKPHTSHPSPKHPYQPQAGLYMYMHSSESLGYWGGIINAVDRHREIGSGFVACSCRASSERARRSCAGVWEGSVC